MRRFIYFACLVLLGAWGTAPAPVNALEGEPAAQETIDVGTFLQAFPGRWVGNGHLYFKGGQSEIVKCRVTYFLSEDKADLRQNIRCASAGGKIELKSIIHHEGNTISGTWHETIYELKGNLSGRPTKNGLIFQVEGPNMNATMHLLMAKGKQIAEIQFNHDTLVGLTLILAKG